MSKSGAQHDVDAGGSQRSVAWEDLAAEDVPAASTSSPRTSEDSGPSRFFMEALQKAARLRRSAAPSATAATTMISSSASSEPLEKAASTAPCLPEVELPSPSSPTSQGLPAKQRPAPPPGPPPSARPRSAMAAIAGSAKAKKLGSTTSDASIAPHMGNSTDIPSPNQCSLPSQDAGYLEASDSKAISGAKPAGREFVDPRLERLHFLEAVQRLRAHITTEQAADVNGDAIAQKVSSELVSGRPQRPQSASARVHSSGFSSQVLSKEQPSAPDDKTGINPVCSASWQ